MSDKILTPYDTGKRAEPKAWDLNRANLGAPLSRKMEEKRFGKVDFDDNEGTSLLTTWVERDEHGRHILHVQKLAVEGLLIEVHDA